MELNDYLVTEALVLGNFAAGGSIGTAATTVDNVAAVRVNQTTAAQTLTIPAPTDTRDGRQLWVLNGGTVAFTIAGIMLQPSQHANIAWVNGTWHAPAALAGAPDFFTDTTTSFAAPDGTLDVTDGRIHCEP
jgi:hypothetical protein